MALANAEMTQAQFAASLGVSTAHVSYVLDGKRNSPTVEPAIEAFIKEHTPRTIAA